MPGQDYNSISDTLSVQPPAQQAAVSTGLSDELLRPLLNPPPIDHRKEYRRIALHLIKFGAVLAALWILLDVVYESFPYTRSGVDIVIAAKAEQARTAPIFAPNAKIRLVVFGVSTAMTGFRPALFDSLFEGQVSSYNMAIPESKNVVAALQAMIARGEIPTHIFLTSPWLEVAPPSFFQPIPSDQQAAKLLFPFHWMPRDLAIFAIRSRSAGGIRKFYEHNRNITQQMIADRGWYFIEASSLFPDHRLPPDFHTSNDHPNLPDYRPPQNLGVEFNAMYKILEQHHIRAYVVPIYSRASGSCPPAPDKHPYLPDDSKFPLIKTIGPDYFLYPNELFSDPVHVNPDGATRYTRDLFTLVKSVLSADMNRLSTLSSANHK
ncbi:MAG TPA: hypothetical protein VFE58_12055 [Tepidisphaeraceae bacterium]|jgi:hypothetical protein|nr:hypothetical protein [Tepidisphaeraceae bacterium]